jgi:small redox-active disulfide protein 2
MRPKRRLDTRDEKQQHPRPSERQAGQRRRTMKIEILGTGCPKCEKLAANAKAAADQLGLDYELCKISEIAEIMKRGVMFTPALAIDGTVKVAGKLVNVDEITKLLKSETG